MGGEAWQGEQRETRVRAVFECGRDKTGLVISPVLLVLQVESNRRGEE